MLISDRERRNDLGLLVATGEAQEGVVRNATLREYRKLNIRIALTDALALDLALIVTYFYFARSERGPLTVGFAAALLIASAVWLAIMSGFQLYSPGRLSPSEEFRRLMEASGVLVAVKVLFAFVANHAPISAASGGWLGVAWALTLTFVLFEREVWHKYMWRLRIKGRLSYRTVILGTNTEAVRIAQTLKRKAYGYSLLGFVSTGGSSVLPDAEPVLGRAEDLNDILPGFKVECMFVASSAVDLDLMTRLGKHMRHREVEVRVSANMAQILSNRLTVRPVGDILALSLRPVRLTGTQHALKRSFDLVAGTVIAVLSMPVWLVCAASVKLTSHGPVLFKQVRVGRGERPFTMYKFRTMVDGAELMLPALVDRNEASGPLFKIRDDPRVNRVGKWLRRWSLDEVPQLINVLKGDMSLVGPRPPLLREVATYEDWHRDRLEVRPGLTGLWQAGGRSELSFDDYVRLDLFYIENWSLSYDLFILAKTLPAVLFRKGAF